MRTPGRRWDLVKEQPTSARPGHVCYALLLVAVIAALPAPALLAQSPQDQPAAPGATGAAEPTVALSFPPNVELRVLIEYVSQRLGLTILYDEQVANKQVTLKSPDEVPVSSLRGLLESALQMKGLVLVPDAQTGFLRVAPAQNLAAVSRLTGEGLDEAPAAQRSTEAVTRLFVLDHVDPRQVEPVVRPLLTQPGGNAIALAEARVLVVSDYAANLERIAKMVALVDQPPGAIEVRFVRLEHVAAEQLAPRVAQVLAARQQVRPAPGQAARTVEVIPDPHTNQVLLIGPPEPVAATLAVVEQLDVPLGLETRVYQLSVVTPQRAERLVRELLDPLEAQRLYRAAVDDQGGLLIITATPKIHAQVRELLAGLDVLPPEAQNPMRFYKLMNTAAVEVLATIRELEGAHGLSSATLERSLPPEPDGPPAPPVDAAPELEDPDAEADTGAPLAEAGPRGMGYFEGRYPGRRPGPRPRLADAVHGQDVTVVADVNTNTLIVVAEPAVQQVYEALIERLDRRRPQVLIEATIVAVDDSENFSLGVDIAARDEVEIGDRPAETLVFSSFGLSEVDPDTGRLRLTPGLGFNGAVLSADIADIVIKALKADSRARVVSEPKVLVNDNATGVINSVSEQPYVSVNASDTVATTSFGGFVEAGTEITVTPHIAEGDHLLLEFEVALNSFTGEGSEGIPPPRQTNAVSSEVTVPDGHTIVVGGINRRNLSESVQRVPILGELPLIEYLFSSRDTSDNTSTLFVFIRPVILRDDRFRDLKFLSIRDRVEAELPADAPVSEPMLVR